MFHYLLFVFLSLQQEHTTVVDSALGIVEIVVVEPSFVVEDTVILEPH